MHDSIELDYQDCTIDDIAEAFKAKTHSLDELTHETVFAKIPLQKLLIAFHSLLNINKSRPFIILDIQVLKDLILKDPSFMKYAASSLKDDNGLAEYIVSNAPEAAIYLSERIKNIIIETKNKDLRNRFDKMNSEVFNKVFMD